MVLTQYEQVNFSTAKQKFSFCKSPRFPSLTRKTGAMANEKIQYDVPGCFEGSQRHKRAPSFGIGDRFAELRKNSKSFN